MRIEENKVVTLDFKVYDVETKEILEDTAELGPFFYIHGIGAFIPKIEEELEGKEKGYLGTLELSPEEGYGEYDPELLDEMSKADFVEFDDIYEGMEFMADMDDDSEQNYVIKEIEDDKVIVDGNHPFSGKNLRFELTVTDVRDATDAELEHGHAHFHGFEDHE
ncbi:MAG: FKBP-type peptidyl-prolyl cis-trans isomerase [Fusobacteriaceae bacterium]